MTFVTLDLTPSRRRVLGGAGVLAIGIATIGLARVNAGGASPDTGNTMVMGMAFDGHQAANLDNTVKFYEVMGYPVASRTNWKVDKVVNALGGTKGAESRTAVINVPSSVADKPFPLILREYRKRTGSGESTPARRKLIVATRSPPLPGFESDWPSTAVNVCDS